MFALQCAIISMAIFTCIQRTASQADVCVQDCNIWCRFCDIVKIKACDHHELVCHKLTCLKSCRMKLISVSHGPSSRYLCAQVCDTEFIFCESHADVIHGSIQCVARRNECISSCTDQRRSFDAQKRGLAYYYEGCRTYANMTEKLLCIINSISKKNK